MVAITFATQQQIITDVTIVICTDFLENPTLTEMSAMQNVINIHSTVSAKTRMNKPIDG